MSPTGACILDAEGLRLTNDERAFFRDANPWGFILFARNVDRAGQVQALCADMREAVGRDAPILVDQEGGRVQRLWAPLVRDWPAPLDEVEAAGPAAAERVMYLRSRLIAAELQALGIDTNCAPTLDLVHDGTHPFLKNRLYGSDPARVAAIGRAVADGHLDGGVLPVMKHMPGHGRAVSDSHVEVPRVRAAPEDLAQTDFSPFKALADLPLGMTGHMLFDQLSDAPTTRDPAMIALIRSQIGFGGLLMTDDISMQALNGTLADRAAASIAAGCDVVLACNQDLAVRISVAQASGAMSAAAMGRAEAALAQRGTPAPLDIPAAEAELERLRRGRDG